MSVNLTEIKDTDLIKDAPAVIWGNFKAIKTWIESLENSYNINNKKISLIDGISTENGGISAKSIILKSNEGTLVNLMNEAGSVMTVNSIGLMTVNAISISSVSNMVSELGKTKIKGESSFEDKFVSKGTLDLRDENSKVQQRQIFIAVVPPNIGSGSTQKLDASSFGKRVLLNCYNNNNQLTSNATADIFLDVSTVLENQEFEIYLVRKNNSNVIAFGNQKVSSSGSEPIFAIMTNDGITDVPIGNKIVHDDITDGSFIKGIWTNVGSSVFRFLIIEMKGFSIE